MKKAAATYMMICACAWLVASARAQTARLTDGAVCRVETQATLNHGQTPLWLHSNKYGLSSLDATNGYVRGAVVRPLRADSARHWAVGYGADVAVATGFTSTLVVQQAYAEVRWLRGTLTVGCKEQPLELKNQRLSSGSQTLGINARPLPGVRLALDDYWDIPGTRGWVALKGHVAYGRRTDDAWQKDFTRQQTRYTEGELQHTKAAYLRLGRGAVTAEVGAEMACEFGGTAYHVGGMSQDVPVENAQNLNAFLRALVPTSSAAPDGNYQNTEGNHLGSWVARLNLDQDNWRLSAYADHVFEDHSSMFHIAHNGWGTGQEAGKKVKNRYFLYDLKDWMLGGELLLKRGRWLREVVVEYLYTQYQGGPVYHDHTASVAEQVSGRDNYYNHHIFTGWQHWGQVQGNPLFLSPIYNADGLLTVENNRFTACHVGLAGRPSRSVDYRLLATWQKSLGTYYHLVAQPEAELSLLAEVTCRLARPSSRAQWYATVAWGMDHGGLRGNNTGLQLTVGRTGWLTR